MLLLKLFMKALILPLILALTIAQWIGTFFTGIAQILLGLLSNLCWIVAILGYLMGICTGHETMQILVMAFVTFIIPECCSLCVEITAAFRSILCNFLRSRPHLLKL